VTRKSPFGNGSTAQGLSKPFARTLTSKAAPDFTAQARVCPAKAGFCSGAFAVLVSSGAQGEVEVVGVAGVAEVLDASRPPCAQAAPAAVNTIAITNAV
jgi:hypothetical protein